MGIKYTLENGIVIDYNDAKHTYYVGKKKVPSVTGITTRGLIKQGLTDWLVNFPQITAKKLINEKLDKNEQLDRASVERIFKSAAESTNVIKEEAGLVGSVVHGLIEDFLKGKSIPAQKDKKVINCWNIFFDWWNKQEYKPVHIEKKLYCKKYNYAGTLDLVVEDKEKNLVLIDIKTSNQVSFDYLLQLNAYWFAFEEETKRKISKAYVVRLPKADKKIEIVEVPLNKKLFNAFIGALYIMTSMDSYWDN